MNFLSRGFAVFASAVGLFSVIPTTGFAEPSPLLNVQFRSSFNGVDFSGAAVIGAEGNVWNQVTDLQNPPSPLVNVSGLATDVTLSFNPAGFGDVFSSGGISGFSGPLTDLMGGYLYGSGSEMSPGLFTFSGLDDALRYDFYFLTQGDSATDGRQLGLLINGSQMIAAPGVSSASTFILGQNYLLFTNQVPSAGSITVAWWSASGEANINGIQVVVIPEPASAAMLTALGAALAVSNRRRRR